LNIDNEMNPFEINNERWDCKIGTVPVEGEG
jgi:hypothetical protein